MIYDNLYWWFKEAVPKDICNKIIKAGLAANVHTASLQNMDPKNLSKSDLKLLSKIRKTNISFIHYKWIYDILNPYIIEANRNAKWNYSLIESENCQFTIYNKNSFYDWHLDAYDIGTHPKTNRKISLVLNLSDPKDYEGGMLEFCSPVPNKKLKIFKAKVILPQGSITVYTSYTWHRVTTVTKGLRYSLVNWTIGDNLK